MTTPWRVRVNIGAGDLVVESVLDPDDDTPPALPAITRLSWVDEVDEDGWPAARAASTGTLGLAFVRALDAAAITAGAPVVVELFTGTAGADTRVARFAGRCGDPEIAPHNLGVVATVSLTDYLADLAGHTVGDAAWPSEFLGDRLDRIFTAADLTPPPRPTPPPPDPAGPFGYVITDDLALMAARDPDATPLLTLVQDTLASAAWRLMRYTDNTHTAATLVENRLYELVPNITGAGALDPGTPWVLSPLPRVVPGPQLVQVGGSWTIEPTAAETIPAGWTRFRAVWGRPTAARYNTVTVVPANQQFVTVSNRAAGEPPVTLRRETDLADSVDAEPLAELLLPDQAPDGWEADRFTVVVSEAPAGWWPGELRGVAAVTGIQPRHHPTSRTFWEGVLIAQQVTIGNGRVEAEVKLRSRPVSVAAAITWDQLAPGITWDDFTIIQATP